MQYAIKAGVIALILANASIFALTGGKPNYLALVCSNCLTVAFGAAVLILVDAWLLP